MDSDWLFLLVLGWLFQADSNTGEPLQNAIQSEDEIIEQNVLSISVPRSMFTDDKLENLQKLIEGKQTLMKHAFQAEQLDVKITDDQISFPGFHLRLSRML